MSVPVGAGFKARQLDVTITKQRLRVGVKGAAPIIDVRGHACTVRIPTLERCLCLNACC